MVKKLLNPIVVWSSIATIMLGGLLYILFFHSYLMYGVENQPSNAFSRFYHPVPVNAKIEKYWFSGLGMDHTYVWKIRFKTKIEFESEMARYKTFESNIDGLGVDTGIVSDNLPYWWDDKKLEILDGKRFRNKTLERKYVFFDKKSMTIYYQWFN